MLALAYIPPPPVHNIELGPLTLHLYGLLIGLGVVLAINLTERLLRRQDVPVERLMTVLLPAVLMGFVGARLYHVASEPVRYAHDPGDIIKIWQGGLGIWGGIALGTITGLLIARRVGIPRRRLLDAVAPGIALAQALGRVGNYVNQELFGRPTDLPWGLEVNRVFRPAQYAGERYFHPTFLYEGLIDLSIGVALLVLFVRWKGRAPGVLFAIYVAAYSLGRFFVEGLRIDDAHSFGPFRQNEWLALTLFVLGTATAVVMQRRWSRDD